MDLVLFALDESRYFGDKVAAELGIPLAPHEERDFEDGEHKARPLAGVRGADVYVVHSLHGGPNDSVNDKLVKLLFFLSAVVENGAGRITAVVPYLAYSRKDRQTKTHDPVTTRTVARLFEAAGVDRVMTLDVHNIVAFQNAFRCTTVHLDTRLVFARRAAELVGDAPVAVASPDPGGVKRAQLFGETLEAVLGRPVGDAFMEKRRSAGIVSGSHFAGEVEDAVVLVVDDLISTGGTIVRAAESCLQHGARTVYAFAAHGLFVGEAPRAIADPSLARTFVTDTVPPFRLGADGSARLEIVGIAPLFAEAIRRLNGNGSISDLLGWPE